MTLLAGMVVGSIFWRYGQDLPDVATLASYRPPSVERTDEAGRVVERREFVPLEQIPAHVAKAFLAAEDQDFYAHEGYSVRAILRAMGQNVTTRRDVPSGASTITQQVAKNVLLTGQARSIERKVKEIILARRIEDTLSKNRILELYLNQIYFGGSAFGVEVAAREYFGKSVRDLSIAEAAYLAALPKGPNDYRLDIADNRERARERRNRVLTRMAEDGFITVSAAQFARAEPLVRSN